MTDPGSSAWWFWIHWTVPRKHNCICPPTQRAIVIVVWTLFWQLWNLRTLQDGWEESNKTHANKHWMQTTNYTSLLWKVVWSWKTAIDALVACSALLQEVVGLYCYFSPCTKLFWQCEDWLCHRVSMPHFTVCYCCWGQWGFINSTLPLRGTVQHHCTFTLVTTIECEVVWCGADLENELCTFQWDLPVWLTDSLFPASFWPQWQHVEAATLLHLWFSEKKTMG